VTSSRSEPERFRRLPIGLVASPPLGDIAKSEAFTEDDWKLVQVVTSQKSFQMSP